VAGERTRPTPVEFQPVTRVRASLLFVVETPIEFSTGGATSSRLFYARSSAPDTANRCRNRLGSSLHTSCSRRKRPCAPRHGVERVGAVDMNSRAPPAAVGPRNRPGRAVEIRDEIIVGKLSNPVHGATAGVLSIVPRAAALYDHQITRDLDGDPVAATEARLVLKDMVPNRIRRVPKADGSLCAKFDLHPAALLSIAGESGRGDALRTVPALSVRVRVK
jgi:hypothetical protein